MATSVRFPRLAGHGRPSQAKMKEVVVPLRAAAPLVVGPNNRSKWTNRQRGSTSTLNLKTVPGPVVLETATDQKTLLGLVLNSKTAEQLEKTVSKVTVTQLEGLYIKAKLEETGLLLIGLLVAANALLHPAVALVKLGEKLRLKKQPKVMSYAAAPAGPKGSNTGMQLFCRTVRPSNQQLEDVRKLETETGLFNYVASGKGLLRFCSNTSSFKYELLDEDANILAFLGAPRRVQMTADEAHKFGSAHLAVEHQQLQHVAVARLQRREISLGVHGPNYIELDGDVTVSHINQGVRIQEDKVFLFVKELPHDFWAIVGKRGRMSPHSSKHPNQDKTNPLVQRGDKPRPLKLVIASGSTGQGEAGK